ncbi:MAG: DUF3800 domain-containing protein [Methanobacteriaceae archaeon]
MIQMFLDESGDLGLKGSNYFVVVIIAFKSQKDVKKAENILKKLKRRAFKKDLKNINEIKSTKISPEMRLHILSKLNTLNISIYAIVVRKNDLEMRKLLRKGVNKTYIKIISKLVKNITIKNQINLKMDKFLPNSYENILYEKIRSIDNRFIRKSIICCDFSQKWKGIQIADLIAWCIFQKYENNDYDFVNKIKLKCEIFEC